MMFGIGDKIEHRVRHLERIRDVQDEALGRRRIHRIYPLDVPTRKHRSRPQDHARNRPVSTTFNMLAVSRLFLDNVQHIQASWLTQGLKLGQTAFRFGADDMGSIMIEENVVSAAGANTEPTKPNSATRSAKPASAHNSGISSTTTSTATASKTSIKTNSMPLKQLSVAFAD